MAEASCLHCTRGHVMQFLSSAVDGIPGATLGFVSFHAFHVSLETAGGGDCPAPIHLLRELLLLWEPFTRGSLCSSLFGSISMPCGEKPLFGRLCCCREVGNISGNNTCFSCRHCSPLSLAGRGEGCHYFTGESGESSMFTALNVSNMILQV